MTRIQIIWAFWSFADSIAYMAALKEYSEPSIGTEFF